MRSTLPVVVCSALLALASGALAAPVAPIILPADAGAAGTILPQNVPAFTVLSTSVPADGVLVLLRSAYPSVPGAVHDSLVIRDGNGVVIAGKLTDSGAYTFFRPDAPWTPGTNYTVTIPNTYAGSASSTAPLTVLAAEPAPSLSLDLALVFRAVDSEQTFSCFRDLTYNSATAPTLESTSREVMLDVSPVAMPASEAVRSQLFASVTLSDDPLASQLAPWQSTYAFTQAGTAPARACAQLQVLDLRTMTTSTGPSVCASTELVANHQSKDITSALAADVCPVPDETHRSRWCTANALRCRDGSCPYYAGTCLPPAPIADAGALTRPSMAPDGGVDAGSADAQAEEEPAGDGGCSVSAGPARSGAASFAVLFAALSAVAIWRRRVSQPARAASPRRRGPGRG